MTEPTIDRDAIAASLSKMGTKAEAMGASPSTTQTPSGQPAVRSYRPNAYGRRTTIVTDDQQATDEFGPIYWTDDPRLVAAHGDPWREARAFVLAGMSSQLEMLAEAIATFGVSVVLDAWWLAVDPSGLRRNERPRLGAFRTKFAYEADQREDHESNPEHTYSNGCPLCWREYAASAGLTQSGGHFDA